MLGAGEAVVTTVRDYLQVGGSVEATARRLLVHPNTVRYRLRRAAQLCGRTPTEARDAPMLQTSITLGLLARSRPPA